MKAALLSRRPPLDVSVAVLKQWVSKRRPDGAVSKYHADSGGPLEYKTAREMEDAMGEDIRREYDGFAAWKLMSTLSKRRKAVLVTLRTCRTWCARYGSKGSSAGAGPGSSTDPVVCRILKRPAASTAVSGPVLKSQARAAADVSGSGDTDSSSSGPTCMDVPGILIPKRGAEALERSCGTMLREYGDISAYRMRKALCARATPLQVPEGILKQWISRYRLLITPCMGDGMSGLHENVEKGTVKRPSAVAAGVLDLSDFFFRGQGAYAVERCFPKILREYGDISAYKLKKRLYARATPLEVPEGILKQWILRYRLPATAEVIGDNTSGLETNIEMSIAKRPAASKNNPILRRPRAAEQDRMLKLLGTAYTQKRCILRRPAACTRRHRIRKKTSGSTTVSGSVLFNDGCIAAGRILKSI